MGCRLTIAAIALGLCLWATLEKSGAGALACVIVFAIAISGVKRRAR